MKYRALVNLLRRADPALSSLYSIDADVQGITHDSRKVKPGYVFAALPGAQCDGVAFVPDAIARGAIAVLTPRKLAGKLPQIVSTNPRRTLARMAAVFHGQPSSKLNVVGITGTNGKTTCTYLVQHILDHAERRCGLISTVDCRVGNRVFDSSMTTPESTDLQDWLDEMVRADMDSAVMEVSSHALCNYRVGATRFSVALFTNLTQDHLDFHVTMDEYFAAKLRLFTMLDNEATAVINIDDVWGDRIVDRVNSRVLTYGFDDAANVQALELDCRVDGLKMNVRVKDVGEVLITSPLTGRFNAYNILGAVGTAHALGVPIGVIAEAIATFTGAPGRLERVFAEGEGPVVFVDYAHTPDALENVCLTLRDVCQGRKLVTVFGCGGDRDKTKRPLMASIAERLSDHCVVTSDNPRNENPEAIINDVLSGMREAGVATSQAASFASYDVEPDRAKAIRLALKRAGNEGVVLIAGKGHEDYQVLPTGKIHFSDREQARMGLVELGGAIHE